MFLLEECFQIPRKFLILSHPIHLSNFHEKKKQEYTLTYLFLSQVYIATALP